MKKNSTGFWKGLIAAMLLVAFTSTFMFRTDTKVLGSDENEWIEEGSDVENNGLHFSQLFIANQFSNFISACQSMHATSVFAKTHPLQAGHTSIPFYLYYHKLLIDF